ncbi:MAG: hypothetical protein ACWA5P_01965 [bacterium]
MIYYLGEKDKLNVPRDTWQVWNKKKKWTYGYHPKYDIVCISKDGTMGNVVKINGVRIGLPKVPEDTSLILNYDLEQKNQKWKRKEPPKGLNDKTQFSKEYESYILEEFRRRKEGVWMKVNGELIYLTGTNYFFLQWIKLDEGYPGFRMIQTELLMYWEACKADERCYGICYVKNRRFGWSSICNSEQIEASTLPTTTDKELGIISKTREDGRKMFSRLVRSFKKLPPFFMPIWDGTTTPKSELLLTDPSNKRKKDEAVQQGVGLDNEIRFHSTVLNAMDGDKIYRSSIDEFGKFPKECPADRYWRIVRTSHEQGEDIVGKAMVGSTVNAMSKGGREFKIVYDQSDPTQRNANNQTASGLYGLFIPAYYCLQGYFDVYGFSVVEDPEKAYINDSGKRKTIGAKTFLENKLESLKDSPEDYNEELRKYPRTEREAFRDEATDCDFNLMKIQEQLDHNEFEMVDTVVTRGNLTWKDGIPDTEVVWRPDQNGRFWIADGCHPPPEFKNKRESKMIFGQHGFAPLASHLGCFGVDPYNRSKTSDGRGSSGSIHLYIRTNVYDLPNEAFVLEYIDRPRRVEDFFEDVIKVMTYYSIPILSELSNESFLKLLKERGYRHFSKNNPFKSYSKLNPTEKLLGGAPPQDTKIGEQQFYATESYIEDYIGVARDSSKRDQGEMGWMPFSRTLSQWKDVDTTKRTKYDAYISSSLALIGCQRRTEKKETKVKRIVPFTKYDNTGARSVIA